MKVYLQNALFMQENTLKIEHLKEICHFKC